MPTISFIIPTHNRADLVAEASTSVLRQPFKGLQLVVVDDGSTDDTDEVLASIGDPRLLYLKQANRGVASARNAGVRAATGDYIAFLDSDDLCLPDRCSSQATKLVDEADVGLVYGWYWAAGGPEAGSRLIRANRSRIQLRNLLLGPVFHWSTIMIRRSWLEEVGGFDEALQVGEEWELTIRLMLAGCSMVCIPEPLSVVRVQPQSLTRDLPIHEASELAVLQKTFSDPRLPRGLLTIRELASAAHLVRVAGSAYLGNHLSLARDTLGKALFESRSLSKSDIEFLIARLVSFMMGLTLEEPTTILGVVEAHLPGNRAESRMLRNMLRGSFHLARAFESYERGEPKQCRYHALKALVFRPALLRDRGLRSILLRSVIGDRSFERLKLAGTHVRD